MKTVRVGWMSVTCDSEPVRGARYAIRSKRLIKLSDPITSEPTLQPSNKSTGFFQIERVVKHTGAGPIPRGTLVEVGDVAEPTSLAVADNLVAPPGWPGLTRLVVTFAPFIPVGDLGLGLLGSIELEHRFRVPLVLGIKVAPIALSFVRNATGATAQLLAKVGFSSDYFEISIEPGAQFNNLEPARFAAGFSLRLGALDGFSLRFSNAYVISGPPGEEKFKFANAIAEAQVPIHRRAFLLFGGGGQVEVTSFWNGYVGTRVFLRGQGGAGTVLFTAALGAAGVDVKSGTSSTSGTQDSHGTVGPMVRAGVEYRF